MMNAIACILNFMKHGPRSNRGPVLDTDATSQMASCRGWSRPDPAVHLRVSENKIVRIFGYPKEEDIPPGLPITLVNMGNGGPTLLYLRGDIPAYVSYIMGEDWRSRLRDDHHTDDAHLFHDGEVSLRPSAATLPSQDFQEDSDALERTHCRRMLRCRAVAVRSEVDINFEETAEDRRPDHLFGWPASGGVWILRSDSIQHLMQYSILGTMIKQQNDMDELCRVLEDAGGQFYSNIEDCPEVVKLSLPY